MKRVLLLLVVFFAICSCKNNIHIEEIFEIGISQYNSKGPLSDMTQVTNYFFVTKGFPKSITTSGSSSKECEEKALAIFNPLLSKVSKSEIDALGLHSSTSFVFSLDDSNHESSKV